jgi:FRG domain
MPRDLSHFYEITTNSWRDAVTIGKSLSSHVFRGQKDKSWPLSTSIERAAKRFNIPLEKLYTHEKRILETFKARAHHFLPSPPNESESIEWLSIIQDYGGPTRLLDFTESFYLASYFAIETATSDACVWAINESDLVFRAIDEKEVGLKIGTAYAANTEAIVRYAETFVTDPSKCRDLVLTVTPPRLNERLAVQKGLFLFPGNLSISFENNLCRSLGYPFDELVSANAKIETRDYLDDYALWSSAPVVKINLPKDIHDLAFRDLHAMNIDTATLFPGLEGFAKSLTYLLQEPKMEYISY